MNSAPTRRACSCSSVTICVGSCSRSDRRRCPAKIIAAPHSTRSCSVWCSNEPPASLTQNFCRVGYGGRSGLATHGCDSIATAAARAPFAVYKRPPAIGHESVSSCVAAASRKSLLASAGSPAPLNRAVGMSWFLEPTPLVPRSVAGDRPLPVPTAFDAKGVVYAGGRGGQRVYILPAQNAVVVRIGRIRNDFDDGAFLNPFIAALAANP